MFTLVVRVLFLIFFITGGACYAVEEVLKGNARNAMCVVRPPGHHAGINGLSGNSQSCGFCIFNTVAIAAMHALEGCGEYNCERVAIVDFDVHHGQGTDEVLRLYNRPNNIIFFSSHLVHCCPPTDGSPGIGYQFYPGSGDELQSLQHNIINVPMAPLWTIDKPTKSKSIYNSEQTSERCVPSILTL